jgi:hypothetical protein
VAGKLDFKAINAAAVAQLPQLLAEWLPDGKQNGKEYFARNPQRDDRTANSFSVNIHSGVWHDFASGDKGGDPISLYAFLFFSGDNVAAARELGGRFGVAPLPDMSKPKSDWVNAQVPPDPPRPPAEHFYRHKPDVVYTYRDQAARPIGYVYRFKNSEGGKETIPLTWCQERGTGREGWHWKAFAEPRPLYGLDRLAAKPTATVLVVEGEKCADAAAAELPELACISWPGGGKAVAKADWAALEGRKVVLWPDCDALADKDGGLLPETQQPGIQAMRKVAVKLQKLGCTLWWVDIPKPGEKPSGWDVADAIEDGLRGADLAAWLREKAKPYDAKNAAPDAAPHGATGAAKKRQDLAGIIDKTEDFEELTVTVANLVKSAGLAKPALEQLLAKIAKKANVPKWTLATKGGGDGGDDDLIANEQIDALNNRHAIVPIGGRILILNRDYDPVLKKNYFTFSGRHDFELRYCNRTVYRRGEPKGIGEVWVNHPDRAQYEGIQFQPGDESNGFLNLWQGWGVEPNRGSCDRFLEFIGETICAGDDALFEYILKWCAHLVQRPQELPETALVLRGKEGAGKNRFASVLGQIVGGEHYLLLTSMGQVSGRFSGHLANALLVFCNEAVWGGDKSAQGVLKSMITDEVQPVEYKGRDITMVANFKRLLMASNEDWVVPRGANDRHYVIVDVDDGRIGDFAYWRALHEEIDNGGAAAFMRHLLDVDITGWHPRVKPPHIMERGWDLKIRGGGSVVQWWFDVLDRGWIGHDEDIWPIENILTETVQDSYIAWATKHKVSHIESKTVLGAQLAKWGIESRQLRVGGSKRKRFYILQALEDARESFSVAFGIPQKVLLDYKCEVAVDQPNLSMPAYGGVYT